MTEKRFLHDAGGVMLPLAGMLFVFFYLSLCARITVDSHHDGTMFKACYGVVHGKVLFRDVTTQYGALTTYIQALFLKLFGETVYWMRMSTVVFYCGSFLLSWHIFKRFLPVSWLWGMEALLLLLGTFNYMCFMPWAAVYGMFFTLAALWCLLRALESKRMLLYVSAGALSSCVFWCRQPLGIVIFLAGICVILYLRVLDRDEGKAAVRGLLPYLAGWCAVTLLFLILFILQGSLADWWRQSILDAFHFTVRESTLSERWGSFGEQAGKAMEKKDGPGYVSSAIGALMGNPVINRILKGVGTLLPLNADPCWYVVPIACIAAFMEAARSFLSGRDTGKRRELAVVSIFAIAAWGGSYYPVSTIDHYYQPFFLMLGVAGTILHQYAARCRRKRGGYFGYC